MANFTIQGLTTPDSEIAKILTCISNPNYPELMKCAGYQKVALLQIQLNQPAAASQSLDLAKANLDASDTLQIRWKHLYVKDLYKIAKIRLLIQPKAIPEEPEVKKVLDAWSAMGTSKHNQ